MTEPQPSTDAATDAPEEVYPPIEALPKSILVDNISPLATSATLEDFFNFCGTIDSLRLRKLHNGTQQSVIVFSDEPSRENALVMNRSSILDTQVTITSVPDSFNFNDDPPPLPPKPVGMFGGGFAAFGDLFNGVGSVVAAEVEKASKAIDTATDTGVLKTAKDQMALARKKTADFASDLDNKWKVRENVKNAAEVSKGHATVVASAVATSTSNLASTVDKNLHISENTSKLAEKARENTAVNSSIQAVTGGFQNLLAQTGLQQRAQSTNGEVQTNGDGNPTEQTPATENAPSAPTTAETNTN